MESIKDMFGRNDNSFEYSLLGRMQQDCEYYLGNGGRHAKHLWAGNEQEHIDAMRALYSNLPNDAKPEWLTAEQIEQYAEQMLPKA